MEIDLFSLYVLICFRISDNVMVRQRTFLPDFVLHTCPTHVQHVHMYAQFTRNYLENITLTELGNKTNKLKRCIIMKRTL